MKYLFSLLFISCLMIPQSDAQENNKIEKAEAEPTLPYHQIPEYPEEYTSGAVVARIIDGLGYRYYWATEGLRTEDLDYVPGNDSRTPRETLEHLFNLSNTILNATKKVANVRPREEKEMSFEETRKLTLENFEAASNILKGSQQEEIKDYQIVFKRGERSSAFPFWNLLNGPIADAINHVGQIVSYRRISGNPLNPMVNVFIGKTKNQ